jgi:hypothetical protein
MEGPFQPAQSSESPLEIEASALPTTCQDATVTVSDESSVFLKVGSARLPTGGEGSVELTLDTTGQPIIELVTDLAFGRHVSIARDVDSPSEALPDCAPSDELLEAAKTAEFSFLPEGCTPGIDCSTVRAAVLSSDDSQSIPAGKPLYSCRVRAGEEEGAFPVACPHNEAVSSGSSDAPVACEDGIFVVTTPEGGDCDLDGCVNINEIVLGVGVALGNTPIRACQAIDVNRDEAATINELLTAVGNSVSGCGG